MKQYRDQWLRAIAQDIANSKQLVNDSHEKEILEEKAQLECQVKTLNQQIEQEKANIATYKSKAHQIRDQENIDPQIRCLNEAKHQEAEDRKYLEEQRCRLSKDTERINGYIEKLQCMERQLQGHAAQSQQYQQLESQVKCLCNKIRTEMTSEKTNEERKDQLDRQLKRLQSITFGPQTPPDLE